MKGEETGCRMQEEACRIKDKGKRIKVGGAGGWQGIRDKRQEASRRWGFWVGCFVWALFGCVGRISAAPSDVATFGRLLET